MTHQIGVDLGAIVVILATLLGAFLLEADLELGTVDVMLAVATTPSDADSILALLTGTVTVRVTTAVHVWKERHSSYNVNRRTFFAKSACFAPGCSCTAKYPFFVKEKSEVLHLLEGPDLGHTTGG